MKPFLLASALLFTSYAHAQESRSETQAIRCAAVSHIHTSIATPAAFNEGMSGITELYGSVFAAFREVRTGKPPTNGELSDRRDLISAEFKSTYAVNPELVVREAALCNTWRAEIAPRIEAQDPQTLSQFVKVAGVPPLAPEAGQVEKWRPLVAAAFAAWANTGYATRASIRKQLQDSIQKR